jgi:hypothetical protein
VAAQERTSQKPAAIETLPAAEAELVAQTRRAFAFAPCRAGEAAFSAQRSRWAWPGGKLTTAQLSAQRGQRQRTRPANSVRPARSSISTIQRSGSRLT